MIATAHTDAEQTLLRGLGAQRTVGSHRRPRLCSRSLAPQGVDTLLRFAGDATSVLPLVRTGGTFASTLLSSADQLPNRSTGPLSRHSGYDLA